MGLWSWIASKAGDTQCSTRIVSLWPWPAVTVGMHHRKFSWPDYRNFTRQLHSGDILISQEDTFFLSNSAINGAFKHCAVYTGMVEGLREPHTGYIQNPKSLGVLSEPSGRPPRNVHERTVTHAISDGVVTMDLGQFLFETDHAIVLRPWKTPAQQGWIVRAALECVGKPYDFYFDGKDRNAFYCTELGSWAISRAGINPPLTIKKKLSLLSRPIDVTIADAFLDYKPVCCSESCNDPNFIDQCMTPATLNEAVLACREH